MHIFSEPAFEDIEVPTVLLQDLGHNIKITPQYWKFENCKEDAFDNTFSCYIQ